MAAAEKLLELRKVSMAFDRLPTDPGLDLGDVVGGDHPTEPATPLGRPGPHHLAEDRLVRRRMIQHLDHLDIPPAGPPHRVTSRIDLKRS